MLDFATLFIAIHGALQIFRPHFGNFDSGDGLYQYRRLVYITTLGVPVLLASLAFINPAAAYTAQGAFCALPSRPIWYRLGLSWIPRFIIGLTVIGLAIAVYVHVELRFRSFAAAEKRASTTSMTMSFHTTTMTSRKSSVVPAKADEKSKTLADNRQVMPVILEPPAESQEEDISGSGSNSPSKEIRTPVDDSALGDSNIQTNRGGRQQSVCTTATAKSTSSEKSYLSITKPTPHFAIQDITTVPQSLLSGKPPPQESSADRTNHTRRRMRRQLHLIFIYPIVYVALWVPTLILYIMQFLPKYKSGLPPALAVTSTMCLTLMGGIDSIVFLLREKPWRRGARFKKGIRGNNGSLSYDNDPEREEEEEAPPTSTAQFSTMELMHSADRPSRGPSLSMPQWPLAEDQASPLPTSSLFRKVVQRPKVTTSDSQSVARELAYERLAMETAERRLSGRSSVDQGGDRSLAGTLPGSPSSATREWWERRDSLA
jgi:hypothetical protein